MLTVDPLAYAKSRQAELLRAGGSARRARQARSAEPAPVTIRRPRLTWLPRLRSQPVAAACRC